MTKNYDVVKEFIGYGTDESVKTKHLYFEEDVLFSYGNHFPLCVRLKKGFVLNSDGYSPTTAHHKGLCKRAIGDDVILMTTREIKELIADNSCYKQGEYKPLRFLTISDINKLKLMRGLECQPANN